LLFRALSSHGDHGVVVSRFTRSDARNSLGKPFCYLAPRVVSVLMGATPS
jgi:hypothetical protein